MHGSRIMNSDVSLFFSFFFSSQGFTVNQPTDSEKPEQFGENVRCDFFQRESYVDRMVIVYLLRVGDDVKCVTRFFGGSSMYHELYWNGNFA